MTASVTQQTAVPNHILYSLSEAEWTQLVNAAFKNYHSLLTLSRSPLANSSLVTPLLIIDQVSAPAGQRGRALRLLLQWALEQVVPEETAYTIGTERPFDDPTWQDPRWWGYNILRHRYIEPLHPDDFVEGGRFTETLIALTGIPSVDVFYDERNQAIHDVAQRLRQQYLDGTADEMLQQLALDEVYRPLQTRPTALALLGIAATFSDVFPRALLLQMAAFERLLEVDDGLSYLTNQRLLLLGDEDTNLWLSPVLRSYVYRRQSQRLRQQRHRQIANYYEQLEDPLKAAEHWQKGGQWATAAEVLLYAADDLINELQINELCEALLDFKPHHLDDSQWREVQLLLTDLLMRLGQREEALQACRQALKVSEEPALQAPLYRRLGKLYEEYNQLHALGYYEEAAERFDPADPERLDLLKDRAWLYIIREEWQAAEADLQEALTLLIPELDDQRAAVFDAFAGLYRRQKKYDAAVEYAREALALREEGGDLLGVAQSFGNLGLLYNAMGEYGHAITAYQEARRTFEKLGNQHLIAKADLNMGMAYHLDGQLAQAVDVYLRSLARAQEEDVPHLAAKAYSNLAEAYAELGHLETARQYWVEGYELSKRVGFTDQIAYFESLLRQMPALNGADTADLSAPPAAATDVKIVPPPPDTTAEALDSEEQSALELARREGKVTTRTLMEAAEISKATATRRLTSLAERGYLQQQGQGRGTHYIVVQQPSAERLEALTHVQNRLREWQVWLAQRYGIVAIGLSSATITPERPLLVWLRFDRLPDLQTFFELENWLTEQLQRTVDCRPVFQHTVVEQINWL